MRYFICLSYSGLNYSGWQIQDNSDTIQERITSALRTLLKEEINVTGAGRTDAGVNAVNYIAHFDSNLLKEAKDLERFIYKMNAILPKDIAVHWIRQVSDNAHARFDARLREYRYYIHTVKDPFSDMYSYRYPYRVDMERMNEAASYFLGKQDFSSLEKLHGGNTTSVCEVYSAAWEKISEGHYVFTVSANRFLRNMVRAMVGSLLEVGSGKKEPSWIKEMLAARNRNAAGNSVPGNALFLTRIEY